MGEILERGSLTARSTWTDSSTTKGESDMYYLEILRKYVRRYFYTERRGAK